MGNAFDWIKDMFGGVEKKERLALQERLRKNMEEIVEKKDRELEKSKTLVVGIGELKNLVADLNTVTKFAIGDVIEWKPGLKNRRIPNYEEPVIISRFSESGTKNSEGESSAFYFGEPLDIVCAMWDRDAGGGCLVEYHHDSRRFRKYVEPKSNDKEPNSPEAKEEIRVVKKKKGPAPVEAKTEEIKIIGQ